MSNKKEQLYEELATRLNALIEGETNPTGIMANACALMREVMGERFFWVGFYLVDGDHLALGPFQGSVACFTIGYGRGVCGTAWKEARTLVVPDVEQFPGHIACSTLSRSEIVVPICDKAGTVQAVLDIDSDRLEAFDETDKNGLEKVATILAQTIYF